MCVLMYQTGEEESAVGRLICLAYQIGGDGGGDGAHNQLEADEVSVSEIGREISHLAGPQPTMNSQNFNWIYPSMHPCIYPSV